MTPAEPAALPRRSRRPLPAASGRAAAPPFAARSPAAPACEADGAESPPVEPAAVAAGKYMVNIGSFANLANADAWWRSCARRSCRWSPTR
jgi:cell division septation protein DedD